MKILLHTPISLTEMELSSRPMRDDYVTIDGEMLRVSESTAYYNHEGFNYYSGASDSKEKKVITGDFIIVYLQSIKSSPAVPESMLDDLRKEISSFRERKRFLS